MRGKVKKILTVILFTMVFVGLYQTVLAHRSGCHRRHSCPSDKNTYICGDKGHCSQCSNNEYCDSKKPRRSKKSPQTPGVPSRFIARIFGVHDGDSLRINTEGGRSMRVRLYGVDCPEIGQPYGIKARALTRQLAYGRFLILEPKGKDRYGRIIAKVYLLTRKMLSQEIVKAGACWWYQKYAPDDEVLAELEGEARAAKRGLWANPNPIPPWDWRKQRRRKQ
jgi:endonuclease YncB( thermonuclease family)